MKGIQETLKKKEKKEQICRSEVVKGLELHYIDLFHYNQVLLYTYLLTKIHKMTKKPTPYFVPIP